MFKTNYTLLLASRGRPVCTNSGAHPGRAPGGGRRRLPRERPRPPPRRRSREGLRGPRRRRPSPAPRAPRGGQPAPREGAGRETAFPQREKLGRPSSGRARCCGGFSVPAVPAGSGAGAARPPGALGAGRRRLSPEGGGGPSAPAGPRGWAAQGGSAAEILVENLPPAFLGANSVTRDLTLIQAMTKKL